MHLGVNVADIFAQNANKEQLERPEEEHSDGNGCDADSKLAPKQKLICEVDRSAEKREQRTGKACKRDQRSGTLESLVMPSMARS